MNTYGIVNVIWLITTVVMLRPLGQPRNFSIPMNNINDDKPITMSGMTNGVVTAPTKKVFPRNLPNFATTIAAIVPRITANVAAIHAIFILIHVACNTIGSEISDLYHFIENPAQLLTNRDLLNENTATQISGRYMNKYPKHNMIYDHLILALPI